MIPEPPPGQEPIDPRGAFAPPPPPASPQVPLPTPGVANPAPPPAPGRPAGMPPMPTGFGPPPAPFGYPPPPPPRRRSAWGIAFRVFLLIVLLLSLVVNFLLLFGGTSGSHGVIEETVSGSGSDKIAVIPIKGIITSSTATAVHRFLDQADEDSHVKAIVLAIDTPGGEVEPADRINHMLTAYKAGHPGTPIVVQMGSMATSGGYYIACAADYIFAEPTTLTGNIGVVLEHFNLHDLADKIGVQEDSITAPKGGFKNVESMFHAEDPQVAAYLQTLVDDNYQRFTNCVVTGRGSKLTKPISDIANGKAYPAAAALQLGLIDSDQGYPEAVYKYAAKQAHLSGPHVVEYHMPRAGLLELLTGDSAKFGGGGGGVTIHGVNISADQWRELDTPRMMAIWRGK